VVAVDGVSLRIAQDQTLGLVGESGSGKSTVGRAVLGLVRPERGAVALGGRPVTGASLAERRAIASDLTVVFQDPYSSLNPARTVGASLAEPLRSGRGTSRAAAREAVAAALSRVGLSVNAMERYPRQFSGGQRQRIAIARALVTNPRLVICDEAVSALDLSIQAQVLNLLRDVQADGGIGLLFITHDLAVVRHVSDEIAVLLRGRVVEHGPAGAVHQTPQHPYTQALLAAAPVPDPGEQRVRRGERRRLVRPRDPELANSPAVRLGCPFVPRCPKRVERCLDQRPELVLTPSGTRAACHLAPRAQSPSNQQEA
jgi:peptide/nickel transport system ATP-binding protein